MKPKSEAALAKLVVEWLSAQHWDVYQEVSFLRAGGVADIAAVQNSRLWIVECKTSLTFTVLEQAHNWRCHFRSVAVPKSHDNRGRGVAYNIAHDHLRLGVLEVDLERGLVFTAKPAPLMRDYHAMSKYLIGQLKPEQKTYCQAGSANGGYYTPYRSTMDRVKWFIRDHPGCTLKQIMLHLDHEHHYANDQTARTSIRLALESWEKGWCLVKKDGKQFEYFYKNSQEGRC